jgi:hypothetical protein
VELENEMKRGKCGHKNIIEEEWNRKRNRKTKKNGHENRIKAKMGKGEDIGTD